MVSCEGEDIMLVTNCNDIYRVKVEEKEEEYFDDQSESLECSLEIETFMVQTRINRSLKIVTVKTNHSFLSSLASAFGFTSEIPTSVPQFIQHPFMVCSYGSAVYRVKITDGKVVGSIHLDQVLRSECEVKAVCGDESGNAVVLILCNHIYSVIVCCLDLQGIKTISQTINIPPETQFFHIYFM